METREVTRSDANSDSSNEECGGIDDGKDCDGDEYVVHRRHLRVALYPPDVALGEGAPELLLLILLPRYLVEGVGVEYEGVDKPSPSASSLSVEDEPDAPGGDGRWGGAGVNVGEMRSTE